MFKKDLGLFVLILVVGAAVALINPRFLCRSTCPTPPTRSACSACSRIGEAFVIITGGIELSVGSIIALLGVIFIDLIVNHGLHWRLAVLIIVLGGCVHGRRCTACSSPRCGCSPSW